MQCRPPGRQYGRKSQSRAAPAAAQYFVQTPTRQTAAGQVPINAPYTQGQGRQATMVRRRSMFNGCDTPPQRRDSLPSGATHNRPFPYASKNVPILFLFFQKSRRTLYWQSRHIPAPPIEKQSHANQNMILMRVNKYRFFSS